MAATKVNIEGALLFEQPLARVPYESYRKVFRTSQRYIERELSAVQSTTSELAKQARSKEDIDRDATTKSLDGMIGRVESLKRKLSDLHETGTVPTQAVMKERLDTISVMETCMNSGGARDPQFSRWADTRLDRWLVDWALRSGKDKTAKRIARDKGIETLVDIDLFMEIRRIEGALRGHSCTEALAWCSENKSALRKAKISLEFDLRLQEYIELARLGKKMEALAYSKKHLGSWYDTHATAIRQAAVLVIVPGSAPWGPYKKLYDESRWETLILDFRHAIYNLNTLPSSPLLTLALYAGLSSLKLPVCYDGQHPNPDCPICDQEGLGLLATEVPWSHHSNSTIVCSITGKIMNEDNPPMLFPNGYVYSKEALEDMAMKTGTGMVVCPRTGFECEFSMLRKVFIS